MNNKLVRAGIVLALAAALLLVWRWNPIPHSGEEQIASHEPPGGDFTLMSAKGAVSLKDFRGKLVMLYFGYTGCPDICPTSLALLGQALRGLTPAELGQVQTIFISVDPERDTPAALATYAGYFHPTILGLTGTPTEVATVAAQYGVVYHKTGDSKTNYAVDHSSFVTLVDRHGKRSKVLLHGTQPAETIATIRELLAAP